ncbi:GNAT family N-acetyltransferase [Loktanella sp. IMCC34160]|uniref:GNAT family N-acetyltransferase n=1 Tax=Loktanella sp. IMCC34160 TaxID=2510646 RepID=UPI00101D58D4|nr:GNAT family N-acetyltransferase [Loktanella sp. IMCC34160]RYG93245.1 GNAT family N-acetyltransferase [Loktanella sp. IMCC34160]
MTQADIRIEVDNFGAFFEAPFAAYGPDSAYVSPLKADLRRYLDKTRNPLFKDPGSDLTYFTAHRGDRVLGRITAHVHGASNRLHGVNRAYFGYFDCADDPAAARALLLAAEEWARARGHDEIAGNFNLTAMQQIGVVTEGFEADPFLDQIWSPPQIARHLKANGYEAVFPMTTFAVDLTRSDPPAIGPKQRAILDDPDFTFAPITRRTIPQRMEEARAVLNASFAENPMFVPVTEEEFHFQAKDMKWVMDPRISAVLHHKGRPAACIICVPDLNPFLKKVRSRMGLLAPWHFLRHRMSNRRAVLIFSGVIPELQGQGINPVVLHRVFMAAKQAGYTHVANTWIADENGPSLAQKEKASAGAMHRLHLFRKSLDPAPIG